MNKWIAAAMIAGAFAAHAKQLKKPDDNTWWMEDGREIELSGKPVLSRWTPAGVEVKSKPDGKGFSFYAKGGKDPKAVTGIVFSPEYPYLTFRITGFYLLNQYRNWTLMINGWMSSCQVAAPQKGIYVYDLFRNLPEKAAANRTRYLTFFIYNLRMDLEYLKLVKKPPYVVRAECADPEIKPGSKVKFTAELEKEAEDVSVSLITGGVPSIIKVNGAVRIQLKPTDKTQKIWSAEVEIKSLGLKKAMNRHGIFMKMDVLGGDLDEPVWVGLPYKVMP
ncbi:MAG: hypothetical protein J5806_14620 [Lentisphaeria bacterium]|nr:hypothetical protein [Lentisphaeria bacterium]